MDVTAEFGDRILLHYRLSGLNGKEIDSNFDGEPLPLRLGEGELEPKLEQCLEGLSPKRRYVFNLPPEDAFGVSDPARILDIPLENFPDNMPVEPNSLIAFTLPDGNTAGGVVLEKCEDHVRVDFNHPLSDCPVVFEVEIVEILQS